MKDYDASARIWNLYDARYLTAQQVVADREEDLEIAKRHLEAVKAEYQELKRMDGRT